MQYKPFGGEGVKKNRGKKRRGKNGNGQSVNCLEQNSAEGPLTLEIS